jgi:hypothetical protein
MGPAVQIWRSTAVRTFFEGLGGCWTYQNSGPALKDHLNAQGVLKVATVLTHFNNFRKGLVPALHPPEYGGQSRYKRDNRHYVAHQCDLRRRVSNFALFIQVVQTGSSFVRYPEF